jgi:hypothetical protein
MRLDGPSKLAPVDIWTVVGPLAGVLLGGVMRDISKLIGSFRKEARRKRKSAEATTAIIDAMVGHAGHMLQWAEFDNSGSSIQRLRPIDQEETAISDPQRGRVSRTERGANVVAAYDRCLLAYRGNAPNSINSDVRGLRDANADLNRAAREWYEAPQAAKSKG